MNFKKMIVVVLAALSGLFSPAFAQEREEKEKARARLEKERDREWDSRRDNDLEFGLNDGRQDSEGDFFDDLVADVFLAGLFSDSSDGLGIGILLAPPPLLNSGMGFGFGIYGSNDDGFAGYLELKAVGGFGQPEPFYRSVVDDPPIFDVTIERFQRAFCLNVGLKISLTPQLTALGGLGWANTSGFTEKSDTDIWGEPGNPYQYFLPDASGDGNKLNRNVGLIYRPGESWGLMVSHDTALSMTSFGVVFGGF